MKKIVFLNFIFLLSLIFFISCNNDNNSYDENQAQLKTAQGVSGKSNSIVDETFIKENVAITDGRILSLSEEDYVKQLVVINFSEETRLPIQLNFQEQEFFDDGEGNDAIAGDGTYTTRNKYLHSSEVPFLKINDSYSVADKILLDNSFMHQESLEKKKGLGGGPTATVSCDIDWVCGCWGTCCGFKVSNCSFTIGWG